MSTVTLKPSPLRALLTRHQEALAEQRILIAGAPPEDLLRSDFPMSATLTVLAERYSLWERVQGSSETDARFSFTARGDEEATVLLFFWPKSHEAGSFLLEQALPGLAAGGSLWLIGENQGGVRRAPLIVAERFPELFGEPPVQLDNARRARLYGARPRAPLAARPKLDAHWHRWTLPVREGVPALTICSLPGVFAHGSLDPGSKLLLDTLPSVKLPPAARALDFGCGAGVLGLSLLAQGLAEFVDFADASALALRSTEESLAANQLTDRGQLRPLSGARSLLPQAARSYRLIISNPPFHEGRQTSYGPSEELFATAPALLPMRGQLLLVANRFLPYLEQLQGAFGEHRAEIIADDRRFRVYRGSGGATPQRRAGGAQTRAAQRKRSHQKRRGRR